MRWPRLRRIVWICSLIGIVALLILPSVIRDRAGSRLKRTMADMRSLGTALGSYQVDFSGYPVGHGDLAEALDRLIPRYLDHPLWEDGWGVPMTYRTSENVGGLAQDYTIVSTGSDGASQGYHCVTTRYYECDVFYSDGQFIQYPGGTCRGSTPLHFMQWWPNRY